MASVVTMTSVSAQSSLVSRPRSHGITSYGALKVSYSSIGFELGSSFLGKTTSLQASVTTRVVPKAKSAAQILPEASYKVSVLDAAGGIKQPLGLLIKMSRDATVVYGTITVFLSRSSAGCRDGRLHPTLTLLFVRPTKKRCINRRSNMHVHTLFSSF